MFHLSSPCIVRVCLMQILLSCDALLKLKRRFKTLYRVFTHVSAYHKCDSNLKYILYIFNEQKVYLTVTYQQFRIPTKSYIFLVIIEAASLTVSAEESLGDLKRKEKTISEEYLGIHDTASYSRRSSYCVIGDRVETRPSGSHFVDVENKGLHQPSGGHLDDRCRTGQRTASRGPRRQFPCSWWVKRTGDRNINKVREPITLTVA
jgi:hypothetical protein